ncbi:mRNA turnover 4 [Allomyces arbusculus]|nr:mRNA turnover 4 [Allomyces arbusculus]
MPKSKRQRTVHLTRTDKVGRPAKDKLITAIRDAAESFKYIHVLAVENMRNVALKDVRSEWADSRFFFGKTKVMALALGTDAAAEVLPDVHVLANKLSGQVGLLFTSRPVEEVVEFFKSYTVPDFARAGNIARETVTVPEGPVVRGAENDPFPHNMEPQLRKLGMPTVLKKGIVSLVRDYTICTKGKALTAEQAQLLKLFYHQQADFRMHLLAYYDVDASKVEDMSHEFPRAAAIAAGEAPDAGSDVEGDDDMEL